MLLSPVGYLPRMTDAAILPPASIGILGGGQLGRFLALAARTMGYECVVIDPDPAAPAGTVAHHLVAAFDDPDALDELARRCQVVTTEFENPPAEALARLAAHRPVRPRPEAIAIAQDRRSEKAFLTSIGVPVAPYRVLDTAEDVAAVSVGDSVATGLLKTARMGYDGKGQIRVDQIEDLASAWDSLGGVACVLETRLALEVEVSVVIARGVDGSTACHPVTENRHVDGILDISCSPPMHPYAQHCADEASELATRIAEALDYVGVLGVEMFLVDGEIVVNELAPRPHNSGHWTLDAAATSQFEQHVRAICGLGLGTPDRTTGAVAMGNLLGDRWGGGTPSFAAMLDEPDAHLHLYGKAEARPGRKMGHVTVTGTDPATVLSTLGTIRP
jgi:5-(carboxyamino)imidazole ribonucleotide synthase